LASKPRASGAMDAGERPRPCSRITQGAALAGGATNSVSNQTVSAAP
jgi:hypothetical protein